MMMMMLVMVVVVGGSPLSREKSRDVLEQPPGIFAKARRFQLADASFREKKSEKKININPQKIIYLIIN